jgi:type I restriction enzyme S subunit
MTLSTFFEKFDTFADAPDAVAKMRHLILQLAMVGKLSKQCKSDLPVDDLLREIERAKGSVKNSSAPTAAGANFTENETAEAIPERWVWVRFGTIARHNAGKTLDKGRNSGELRNYITTSNLYWGFFRLESVRQMPIQDDELERCTAIKGDLLICEGGEAGRAAVWPHDQEISFQNHVHRARFFAGMCPYFVQRYFEKLNATGEIDKYRKGVGISNMSGKSLASIPIPLPPLAEQKRIVAKVDELMALCDRLEAQQQERETRHAALARASLARFAAAPTPANLPFLFHPSYTIPPVDLRKSILTLAVQGKLVPQDPNDEPAENRGLKGELKAAKWAGPIAEKELPFELPPSWMWRRLGDIAILKHGYAFSSDFFTSQPAPFVLTTPGNFYEKGGFRDRESKRKYFSGPVDPAFIFKPGDLIIPMTEQAAGLLGSPAFIPDDGRVYIHNQRLGKLTFLDSIAPEFAFWFFNCDFFRGELARTCTGMKVRHTSPDRVLKVPFPLPPLAEQRRIVAKVDQLMALVDELETQLAASRKSAGKLLEAAVTELIR